MQALLALQTLRRLLRSFRQQGQCLGGDGGQQFIPVCEVLVGRARRDPGVAGGFAQTEALRAAFANALQRQRHQRAAQVAVVVGLFFYRFHVTGVYIGAAES